MEDFVYVDGRGKEYEGEWEDLEKKDGRGVWTCPDGTKYTGGRESGHFHGHGMLMFSNGRRYEGEWKDGKQSGRGVLMYADGERKEREWKDDVLFEGKDVSRRFLLEVLVMVDDIEEKIFPLVRKSQMNAVESAEKARNTASVVERMFSLLSQQDKGKEEETEIVGKDDEVDEIDEIKMKNAIIEYHKEFIGEQRKRYEGFMDEVTDILTCPITMVVMRDPVVADDSHTYETVTKQKCGYRLFRKWGNNAVFGRFKIQIFPASISWHPFMPSIENEIIQSAPIATSRRLGNAV
jgi:hypothetical protein